MLLKGCVCGGGGGEDPVCRCLQVCVGVCVGWNAKVSKLAYKGGFIYFVLVNFFGLHVHVSTHISIERYLT